MKYKVLGDSSVPRVRLGLCKGHILDDEVEKRLTKEIVKELLDSKTIEAIGKKREPDERRD